MLKAQFNTVMADIVNKLSVALAVPVNSWQSTRAPQPMPEIFNYSFTLNLDTEDIAKVAEAIGPNLPWADNHFRKERASGRPINPGETWKEWPFGHSAKNHLKEGDQFDHSYAERYWPRYAGKDKDGMLKELDLNNEVPHRGIRDEYGDILTLIEVLQKDPLTRQAYLPVWFPEDLEGAKKNRRVPCSLGYHFIRRDDKFHCMYFMRSCDYLRHFHDDVYLTIRLQLWLLNMLKYRDGLKWDQVKPGTFTMHITSLHMFESDRAKLRGMK